MSGRKNRTRSKRAERTLLKNLADALNACEKAGMDPKLGHGSVFLIPGFVLPLGDRKGNRWVVRMPKKHGRLFAQAVTFR